MKRGTKRIQCCVLGGYACIDDDSGILAVIHVADPPRPADFACGDRHGLALGRTMEGIGGGVVDRRIDVSSGSRFVEVPDAGVVGPDVVGVERLAGLRGAVPHREFRTVRHAREAHPHERLARRVPRVDVVGEAVPLGVDEADVHEAQVAPVGIEIGIREAGDRGRKPHEDGEVGEDFRFRVARDGELHAARELGDGRVGARQIGPCGQRERTERQHGSKQRDRH